MTSFVVRCFLRCLAVSLLMSQVGVAAGDELRTSQRKPPASLNAELDLYLLMGQSNMAGRDTASLAAQTDDSRILTLDVNSQWVVARDPIHAKTGRIEPGAGPGIAFARAMLEDDPGRVIGLIPTAVGGTSLRRWERGGDLYEAALARARAARAVGVLRGVLWHQGEADSASASQARTYGIRLAKMFRDLRTDLQQPGLPIVVGLLGEFVSPVKYPEVATVQSALRMMPALLPKIGVADSTGLEHLGDELHFSAEASRQLGMRYATAMRALSVGQRASWP